MALVEPLEFERLVLARNPASTKAKHGRRLLALLEEAFGGRLHQVETQEDERANIEGLAALLRDGDLVAPLGGDSTATQAAGAVALRPDLGKVPLLPLPSGHANQLALMLNSRLRYTRPVGILRHGRTVPIYPFIYTHRSLPAETTRLALFTIGIGVTGMAAFRLDTPDFRTHPLSPVPLLRKIPETVIVARAFRDTQPFRKDGRERVEVLLANGRRVAKHGRFDVTLPGQTFALLELADKRATTLAPVLGRFAVQLTQPAELRSDETLTLTIEAIDGAPILGQHDGHPFVVQPGEITITRAKRPLYVVTTRRSLSAAAPPGEPGFGPSGPTAW